MTASNHSSPNRPSNFPDRPIAHPIVSSTNPSSRPESRPSSSLVSGNTPRAAQAVISPARLGRRGLLSVAERLSDRDWAVLRSVADHRFLTSKHVEGFQFADHSSPHAGARASRRVLRHLLQLRVLEHLERRIGGVRAGSASFVWRVGSVGERLLRLDADGRGRTHEPSERFLRHCLAIADAHLAMIVAQRAAQLELLRIELEPTCWRSYLGPGGERRSLQPDLHVVTGAGEYEDHWFVEIDLGNEHLPTLIKKCQQYLTYRDTGHEQQLSGVFPVVVWVMPNQTRVDKLSAAIQAAPRMASSGFRVTTAGQLIDVLSGGAA